MGSFLLLFYLSLTSTSEAYWRTGHFELASVNCFERVRSLSRDPQFSNNDAYGFRMDLSLRPRDEIVAIDLLQLPFRKGRGPRREYIALAIVDPQENINPDESRVPDFRVLELLSPKEARIRISLQAGERVLIARLIPAQRNRAAFEGHLLDLEPEGYIPFVLVAPDANKRGGGEVAESPEPSAEFSEDIVIRPEPRALFK